MVRENWSRQRSRNSTKCWENPPWNGLDCFYTEGDASPWGSAESLIGFCVRPHWQVFNSLVILASVPRPYWQTLPTVPPPWHWPTLSTWGRHRRTCRKYLDTHCNRTNTSTLHDARSRLGAKISRHTPHTISLPSVENALTTASWNLKNISSYQQSQLILQ